MATISAMLGQTSSIYAMMNRASGSSRNAANLSLVNSVFGNNENSYKTTSSAKALYNSYRASSEEDLKSLQAITSGIQGLTTSYYDTKKVFNAEYSSSMSDLRSAAKSVKTDNYEFNASDITTDAKGVQTYSKDLQKTINNVKNLVSSYNDTLKFLGDNKSVSTNVASLANSFADTKYFSASFERVGIKVESNGALTLSEKSLAKALTTNPASSKNVLANTLAGRADSKAAFAERRSDSMFPSMNTMLKGELGVASLYTGSTLSNVQKYTNSLNLFNIFI